MLYDNADRVVEVLSAYGTPLQQTTLTQTYTSNGEVATVVDARGNTTAYEYDGIDRLIKVRYPNPASAGASTTDFEQFSYNAAGAVTQRRLRDGGLITFSYDALMRVTLVDAPSGTNDVSYAYDNLSRLTQSVAGGQTLNFAYDQLSRLTGASSPLGTVAYQYDLAGRQTRITWPDAFYAAYEYDVAGALTAVRENGATSGAGVLALYTHDDLGRRVSITRGNGVVTTYAYDSASRLDVLSHNLSGTGSDLSLDFSYNSAGQIVGRDRTSSNSAYVYPQPGINVDAYASNNRNQITMIDGAALTYDARGNLTGAGGVNYSYDAFNRLIAAGPMSLSYDPAGRLYETSASGTTTRFLYDGLQAIAEYNTAGALIRRYVPGAGLDEHLAWYEGSGTADRRWLIQDDLGSVVAVTNASGASLSINAYDEYGAPAAANSGLSGYTGQMYLAQAGLYHYRARAYSPALGRFLQTDPIGMAGGMNLYAYTDNDPVNLIDPLGLQETTEAPDLTVVALRGIEDMVNSMNANQASVLIARGALLARLSRLRPRNRFPLRPDRPTDEEIEASCRWVTVPSLPGRPDDWRFRSGPTISVLATGAAITSSYDVSAQGWQVSSSGRLIPNLCGPTNCDARRRGFVFAGTQVRQVWTRGTTGRFEWMVTNNGAVPDAGGDLGGEAVIVVQKLECSE